jgi:hypothetical protein
MHASEFCGSSVSLAIAEDLIAIHSGERDVAGAGAHGRSGESHLFHIVPRISPDAPRPC